MPQRLCTVLQCLLVRLSFKSGSSPFGADWGYITTIPLYDDIQILVKLRLDVQPAVRPLLKPARRIHLGLCFDWPDFLVPDSGRLLDRIGSSSS
eukprot:1558043-Amphidinium_carterae.2